MKTYLRDSIYKMAVAIAHLWFSASFLESGNLPEKAVYWVYSKHLEFGDEALKGKRIQVTIEIVDHTLPFKS